MMRLVYFKGIPQSNYGLLTVDIKDQLLAPVAFDVININGRSGAVFTRSTLQHRSFEVTFYRQQSTMLALRQDVRKIAAWLHSETEEEFYITGGQQHRYKAKVRGAVDFERELYSGQFKVTFLASNPLAYAPTKRVVSNILTGHYLTTAGTAPTQPIYYLTVSNPLTSGFTLTDNKTGKFIKLTGTLAAGKRYIIDTTRDVVEREETGGNVQIMTQLDIDSQFFPLTQGGNQITLSPTTGYTMTAEWYEMFY